MRADKAYFSRFFGNVCIFGEIKRFIYGNNWITLINIDVEQKGKIQKIFINST